MRITYKGSLKRKMSDERTMQREYGTMSRNLFTRLSVLEAADSLADVPHDPPERMHPLKGNLEGKFAVDVTENFRLIFEPADGDVPRNAHGAIVYEEIREIRILKVEDYHGR